MSLFRKVKVFFHNIFLPARFISFIVGLVIFSLKTFPVEISTNIDIYGNIQIDSLDPEQLTCERVRKRVLDKRKSEFTLRVNPSHNWIEEFLEIISENKNTCQGIFTGNTTNVKLLVIIVNSKMDNFNERQVIRESYGSIKEFNSENVKWHVRTAFLVAQSHICHLRVINETNWIETKAKEIQLEEEQRKYGDLVIGSFMDTYKNNTYKQLMGFKFVSEQCPQADLVVKTDDDVFVNVPAVIYQRMVELKGTKTQVKMYCPWFKKRFAQRRETARYFVQENEWPIDAYPDFCAGAFMILSFDWMKMLYSVRSLGGFLWIDDTHVSGRLREIAEKEFGVKAKVVDINKRVWWEGLKDKNMCANLTPENKWVKRKKLPLFVQFVRNKNMEHYMKCLTILSLRKTNT